MCYYGEEIKMSMFKKKSYLGVIPVLESLYFYRGKLSWQLLAVSRT